MLYPADLRVQNGSTVGSFLSCNEEPRGARYEICIYLSIIRKIESGNCGPNLGVFRKENRLDHKWSS
jgi:hypothetical protein